MAEPEKPSLESVAYLNALPEAEARAQFTRCCGASRWVVAMLSARPFASPHALLATADAVWRELEAPDYLEAFSHHPEIGEDLTALRKRFASTAELSLAEQAAVTTANDETLLALRAGNRAYRERFGYSFIVCATGKSAAQMLSLLEQRMLNSAPAELGVAAREQAEITRLRLQKLGSK